MLAIFNEVIVCKAQSCRFKVRLSFVFRFDTRAGVVTRVLACPRACIGIFSSEASSLVRALTVLTLVVVR